LSVLRVLRVLRSELPRAHFTALQATPDVLICHNCAVWAAKRTERP
jgi:hypothetical protein